MGQDRGRQDGTLMGRNGSDTRDFLGGNAGNGARMQISPSQAYHNRQLHRTSRSVRSLSHQHLRHRALNHIAEKAGDLRQAARARLPAPILPITSRLHSLGTACRQRESLPLWSRRSTYHVALYLLAPRTVILDAREFLNLPRLTSSNLDGFRKTKVLAIATNDLCDHVRRTVATIGIATMVLSSHSIKSSSGFLARLILLLFSDTWQAILTKAEVNSLPVKGLRKFKCGTKKAHR